MGKLAGKTAAYTLLFVFACVLFALSALTLFSPMTLSDAVFNVGGEKLSVRYAEIAWRSGGDTAALAKLVERSSLAGKYGNVVVYGPELTGRDDFPDYCAYRDERPAGGVAVQGGYADYIGGLVASAYYRLDRKTEALDYAEASDGDSYPQYGARAGLLYLAIDAGDEPFARTLYERLLAAPPADRTAYDKDLNILRLYLKL